MCSEVPTELFDHRFSIDEDTDDKLMVETNLCFQKNYNMSEFFKKLKVELNLRSVKLTDGNE
ncbi:MULTISPECIES: hypothetical protein [Peptoniphilus]|uniref:hypothetical protein n=1 Tax=Peptoniphilus TaxID=162289 RepID=UPI00056114F5|nr:MULTISPECIES: hypothetical protein [Peptoniphilus]